MIKDGLLCEQKEPVGLLPKLERMCERFNIDQLQMKSVKCVSPAGGRRFIVLSNEKYNEID